ncbi:MAG TPA: serine/threonine-protein kinase [Blastocatellia bacterium]|nr:serine/threonine-protein kinase [Blastocatellia bacterium]
MFCVFCGSNIADGLAACPQCKAPLPARKLSKPNPPSPPQAESRVRAAPPVQPQAATAQPPEDLTGRVLAGRYRITGKLGAGAMGAVYKAEDMTTRRPAAIKLLSPDRRQDAEYVARFQREASMAARIAHPNAVRTFDAGTTEDGFSYIAMEYVEGQPLSQAIKAGGPLPLERVVAITWQAAAALHSGHELNVVHRDFKPDNVLLCRQPDGADYVKVLDFGLAKPTAVDPQFQELTQMGYVVGTPQYISPEQVKNEPTSARSDLYSLAIVVYEMLAGGLPFTGKTPQRQMFNRLLEEPMAMSVVNPALVLPPEVEMVVMKALSRRPEERYASTVEFAQALSDAALGGFDQARRGATVVAAARPAAPSTHGYAPPANRPAPAPPSSQKTVIAVIAGGVLLALLLLAMVAYLWLK